MNLAQRLTEIRPSVDWNRGRLTSRLLYARAFGSFGSGSVIVRPRILRGTDRIHVGADVAVYPGAWLQCEADGGPLEIGDGTYLGHNVHLHATGRVTIGRECFLADEVYVGNGDHRGTSRHDVTQTGDTIVGDRVFIGQRAIVLGGVTIGDDATIGAGSVVTRDVPAGVVAAGIPARILGSAE